MALYVQFKSGYEDFDIDTAIKEGIEDNSIRTWLYDEDGDITHKPAQWQFHAWFRYIDTKAGVAEYDVIMEVGYERSEYDYGVACGRFSEMLLAHFSKQIAHITLESFD